jgi:hypothetical protein
MEIARLGPEQRLQAIRQAEADRLAAQELTDAAAVAARRPILSTGGDTSPRLKPWASQFDRTPIGDRP